MINILILDTDGIVVYREKYFSERMSDEFGASLEETTAFFKNEYKMCAIGQADLKQELAKDLGRWHWKQTVDDLIKFWFEHENVIDFKILEYVGNLRNKGIKCYLDMDNEKYREQYLVENMGLGKHFDGVFSSASLGFLKSDLGFWAAVYERLGRPVKTEALVWDDDQKNVAVAKDFGFQAEHYKDFQTFKDYLESQL